MTVNLGRTRRWSGREGAVERTRAALAKRGAAKERPILFSGPMVRAILAGTKAQTRRVVNIPGAERGATHLHPVPGHTQRVRAFDRDAREPDGWEFSFDGGFDRDRRGPVRCPYGAPGVRLWVRETFSPAAGCAVHHAAARAFCYRSDEDGCRPASWRPAIHMPRAAARITLEITSVRVERLQDISEEDARAEGVSTSEIPGTVNGEPAKLYTFGPDAHRKAFAWLWDAINGKRAPWSANPWVWVVSFRRVTP